MYYKIEKSTGVRLYSVDKMAWYSTEEAALKIHAFKKMMAEQKKDEREDTEK